MLAVAVHREGMCEARLGRAADAFEHGGALALVVGQDHDFQPWVLRGQFL